MELLIGCGRNRDKRLSFEKIPSEWIELVTLDIDPDCEPDIVHDLEDTPYPFEDNTFTEIHAYEVLEHCGYQGNWQFFFEQFDEFWRILKPGGWFLATCPQWDSPWAWGDPGHKRVISKESLVFLDREEYEKQIKSSMTDYRKFFNCDFERIAIDETSSDVSFGFVLRARK